MSHPPFTTVFQALNYFIHSNPARQRELNILELDGGCKPNFEQFSGGHPQDLWASVCKGIQRMLDNVRDAERVAFELYYLHKAPEHMGKQDIAKELGLSTRVFNRMINNLEDELIRRDLVQPPDFWQ